MIRDSDTILKQQEVINKSCIPDLHFTNQTMSSSSASSKSSLYNQSDSTASSVSSKESNQSLATTTASGGLRYRAKRASLKEYGSRICHLGEGSSAIVKILRQPPSSDKSSSKLFAVKQYHKKSKRESEKDYMKRLTSEFCISSTFSHPNIIKTFDLVLDSKNRYCTIMEYCPGGDLFSIIMAESMTDIEKACCCKQLLQGLSYLHSIGVAHRDIKPENLLMTLEGTLKITDFGVSDVFRRPWESKGQQSKGLCGSEPYIAPEAFFVERPYWGPALDVWSAGIVFYTIWLNGVVWERAARSNCAYKKYEDGYSIYKDNCSNNSATFQPFLPFATAQRETLYNMLSPVASDRITVDELLKNDPWIKSIQCCNDQSIDSAGRIHKHTTASNSNNRH